MNDTKVCPRCDAHFIKIGTPKCLSCKRLDSKRKRNAYRRKARKAARKAAGVTA